MNYTCKCGKSYEKTSSYAAHTGHCKIYREGKEPIDRFSESRAWSKGLTKKTDERVNKIFSKTSKKNFLLDNILAGEHPQYQSRKLKIRLIDEGIFKDKCYECGWSKKRPNEKYSTCELHHKNGDSKDHRLENLIILCPNCHSLTSNFRNLKRD